MPRYLFVYNEKDRSFPERYRVVRPGEDAEALRDAEGLTGTVPEAAAVDLLDELFERCSSAATTRAELVDAVDWGFVERSYRPRPENAGGEVQSAPSGEDSRA